MREDELPRPTGFGGLEARELLREFGPHRAVDGISFDLPVGAALALFGPNGAGKTTLLRLLSGGLAPTRGTLSWRGLPVRAGDPEWARRVGVLSHEGFLYGRLRAEENLRLHADLFLLPDPGARVRRALEDVGLADRSEDRVATFSRGMRQRLALARTLLHAPEVVLLDEPFTGLDASASETLRTILRALRDGGRTVVVVTHNLEEGLELADHVAIQARGRFLGFGPVSSFPQEDFARYYRELLRVGEER